MGADVRPDQRSQRHLPCPAIYPVLPRAGKANGRAVLVVPGGGYQFVSIEQEGLRVADALAARGYTAFVLKYRTVATPRDATAIRLVRDEAGKRGLRQGMTGVIGFSAGARSTIRLLEGKEEASLAENVALIYPPMTQAVKPGPPRRCSRRSPSMIRCSVRGRVGLIDALLKESERTEFHLYSGGSHGFGMGIKGTTSDLWIDQYIAWLDRH